MKYLKKLLIAAVLVAAAIASTPKTAVASVWCTQCANTDDCFDCCMCDVHNGIYCDSVCP